MSSKSTPTPSKTKDQPMPSKTKDQLVHEKYSMTLREIFDRIEKTQTIKKMTIEYWRRLFTFYNGRTTIVSLNAVEIAMNDLINFVIPFDDRFMKGFIAGYFAGTIFMANDDILSDSDILPDNVSTGKRRMSDNDDGSTKTKPKKSDDVVVDVDGGGSEEEVKIDDEDEPLSSLLPNSPK